ncbi:SIMPL domain-containing protein [Modicisalibacter sp. 'Wilcox']|uniref:SIMPL domain-containing protein n=1 Tax=Modicisalibacter sp. 'Wilcox' TaxID=2679914 RepID=UPI0013D16C6C|nr:SIMPL domain-containing protein [Modicisalibacter sp. 'Wilcox']
MPPLSWLRITAAAALIGTAVAAHAQTPTRDDGLSVEARATLNVAPDTATLDARLWERTPAVPRSTAQSTDPEALAEARQRLEARIAEVIRTLEVKGVSSRAIQAGSLSVHPDYLPAASRDGDAEPRVRTQLERPITIHLDTLSRLPIVLDILTGAGVDALDGVTYDLADRDAAADQALQRAIDKARHKAQLMAQRLGIALGPVVRVAETTAPDVQPRTLAMRAEAAQAKGGSEYRAGEIEIDAGVAVTWAIAGPDGE